MFREIKYAKIKNNYAIFLPKYPVTLQKNKI